MSQNYKDTLLLPKTDFPMKADLVTREPQRLEKWEATGLYRQILDARKDAELFVLHDGPPFANGDVHMGTALNKVLKDLIVKSKSMAGYRAPFVPGWDCHGLPIEFKVVKESRGLQPAEVRRRSEDYARKYIGIQRGQFKRLGVLGDWENPYLTLAPEYEAQIIRSFATFVEKDLVYQSKKPVYWSTGAQTALAEAEVEYADREDPAIFVKFALTPESVQKLGVPDGSAMVIWTTTPWTLPANVAIAIHPRHEYVVSRYRLKGSDREEHFVVARALQEAFTLATDYEKLGDDQRVPGAELAGSEANHPFLDRRSRIIAADFVTMDTGTGQVHVAPGHGSDDYIAGVENGLPILSPVDDQGRFTEEVGVPVWAGKYVFDANKDVIAHLRENKTLLGEQVYQHSYPHCWRSKTPVVFRAVEQFFIKVDKLRDRALAEIDKVSWIPHWGRNRIYGTVESRPDWCISRQRSWGVPLPAFYNEQGKPLLDPAAIRTAADLFEAHGTNLWFEKDDAWWAAQLGLPVGTSRRNDTLDVWLDSGVSHEAVLKKHPELRWPADVYIEATDQHRGWFQSSLMTSVALNEQAPYSTVITHGFVVDKDTRKKVSKSEQGNYVKPMNAEHFVGKYGADIVRLWASSVEFTHEVPFSEESFKVLTEAYRQFRNVTRILLANLFDFDPATASLDGATSVDRWMLSRLQEVIETCRKAYAEYDFRRVFQTLNQFVTVDVSALYVDITKDRMYCDAASSPRRRATQFVMNEIFDSLCRLLAPILAYTADEAWEFRGRKNSVHLEEFPRAEQSLRNEALEQQVQEWLRLRAVIAQQAIEPARQQKVIGNALEAAVTLQVSDAALLGELKGKEAELEEFFILSDVAITSGDETKATLVRTDAPRCARCWRHRRSVGLSVAHPELCDRCASVVAT
jgi:isoleucyl-tRNA synthetase